MPCKQLNVLHVKIAGHAVGSGREIKQAAGFGFLYPIVTVAVAVEDDALMLAYHAADKLVQVVFKIRRALERVGILAQGFGDRRVQHDVRAGYGDRGAKHTELELVAGEREGRGAVAVSGVLGELGQHMNADLYLLLDLAAVGRVVFDGPEYLLELLAEEHGDNGRGRLIAAETVVVCRAGNGNPQHVLIIVYSLKHRAEHKQKLRVFVGCFARLKEVCSRIGGHGPVIVLAAAVDAREGLLMQQAYHVVFPCQLLHELHRYLIMVGGDIGRGVYRRELMLRGSNLVVLGLCKNAELPELLVELLHERRDAGLYCAVVVVVQLLTLGRHHAE